MLKLWLLRPHDRLRDDERPDYDENPTTNPWEPENDARQLAQED